jgi:ankyrin repeat protein
MRAVYECHKDVCCFLVDEGGSDQNIKAYNGRTALDLAIIKKNREIGVFLNSRDAITKKETYPSP